MVSGRVEEVHALNTCHGLVRHSSPHPNPPGLRRMEFDRMEEVHSLNTYSVENVPGIVAVLLNRTDCGPRSIADLLSL